MLIMFYVDYVLKYHREIPQILSNLTHQPKAFYFSTVLDPGSHNINSGCVNIAVSQNICQFSNIFFDIKSFLIHFHPEMTKDPTA